MTTRFGRSAGVSSLQAASRLVTGLEPLALGSGHGAVVERAVTAGDAHVIDEAARFETPDDLQLLLGPHSALLHVVELEPHAERSIRADRGAHRRQRLDEEPHPVLERAAVSVG